MLKQDYITELLNLEDVIITDVKNISDQLHIYLELSRRKHICPCCGAQTDRVHDYRKQIVKDIPFGRTTLLHLRKRRYRCACGKRFYEKNTFLPRYYRVTSRLVAEIIFAFKKLTSAKDIGSRFNVSSVNRSEQKHSRSFSLSRCASVLIIRFLRIDTGMGLSGSIPKSDANFCAASANDSPYSLATKSMTSPCSLQAKQWKWSSAISRLGWRSL